MEASVIKPPEVKRLVSDDVNDTGQETIPHRVEKKKHVTELPMKKKKIYSEKESLLTYVVWFRKKLCRVRL